MKNWFLSLAPRERLLVAAAAAVTVAAVFFLAVWEPLHKGAEQLEERIVRERDQAAWIAAIAAEAETLRATGRGQVKAAGDSLLSVIDRSSRNAGLGDAVQRIQPEGDNRAAVTLEGSGFNALLVWLRTLEQTYGVSVAALTVSRGEQPGTIQARMTLRRTAG